MIERRIVGEFEGSPVHEFTIANKSGLRLSALSFGATVNELHMPNRSGALDDIVLGLETLEDYIRGHPCLGSTVGRCANRIRGASFELDGRLHSLDRNDGANHLHGGVRGFHRRVWRSDAFSRNDETSIRYDLVSRDGDEGYPGSVSASATYTLTDNNEFRVDLEAATDVPTIVNLAHHSYWNLGGHASGSILDHTLRIDAARFTPVDAERIPTGEVALVEGTPFDFRTGRSVGAAIAELPEGFDMNYILNEEEGLRRAAFLFHPGSGRTMELFTTEPGLQLFTGNILDGSLRGKSGARYPRLSGLCLESQKFPDAIHHPSWPSPILRPGETYLHTMVHRLGVMA